MISQVEIYCKQQYCAKEQISALNPYKFDRKMHNFFKDTIPKGENFKRRILIKLKVNVTVVHCCFSKLNLWVKFSCLILNNKVNIANVRVVFSAKNVSDKIKSNTIKNVLWWILLQYFKNAKFSFPNVFCPCISLRIFCLCMSSLEQLSNSHSHLLVSN